MPPPRLNDVFEEVEKFTWFQRVIGVSTLIHSDGKLQISRKLFMTSMIIISVDLFMFFYTLYTRKTLINISNWFLYLKIAYSILSANCIVASWIRSNKNLDLLNTSLSRVRAVDLKILSLGKELPTTKPSSVTFLIYSLMATSFFFKASSAPSFLACIQLFILYSPHILILSIVDSVDRIATLLRLRFCAIKKQLLQCFGMEGKKAILVLDKLVFCHHHLSNSSEGIDEYFSVQVLSVLAVVFTASFSEFYAISIIYKDDNLTSKEVAIIEKALWIVVMIVILSRICHQFSAITFEAKKFNAHLYEFMIGDKRNHILKNSKLELHIAMNREVVFTASGFLKLDYSLLHCAIASSTSYLVILIQYGTKQPSSGLEDVTSG